MVIKRLRTADNSAGMAEKIIKNDTLRIFLDTEMSVLFQQFLVLVFKDSII